MSSRRRAAPVELKADHRTESAACRVKSLKWIIPPIDFFLLKWVGSVSESSYVTTKMLSLLTIPHYPQSHWSRFTMPPPRLPGRHAHPCQYPVRRCVNRGQYSVAEFDGELLTAYRAAVVFKEVSSYFHILEICGECYGKVCGRAC